MHRGILVLFAFAATAAVAQFSYDSKRPVDPRLVSPGFEGSVYVQDITYSSPKGGLVPAYLFTRPYASPAAAVLFMHWGLGDRHAFYDDALALANDGVTTMAIDAPFVRANPPKDENTDVIQAVVDARRAVDVLIARRDVDPKRIGFVGLSYGAHIGAILASVEPRISAFVLAGGLASNADAEKNPALAPYDAEKWIAKPHTAPVFLQFARSDEYISRDQAGRFIKAAGDRSIYKWYEGSHQFNVEARRDREAWLASELRFSMADPTYRPVGDAPGVPKQLEIGKLGVVVDMPGMQHVPVRGDIAFKPDLKMDVYYPFGMTSKDRVPAIIAVNGQSTDIAFMKSMRHMRFATTFAEALAVRTNRIVVMPDIRPEGAGDAATDLGELIAYLTSHASELQIDATQMAIVSRSAGYSYALKAATAPSIKALALWYGNLGDPNVQSVLRKDLPTLVVTAEHDFWYDAAAAQKFVDATGAQHIHLPDAGHAFEIIDDLDQSRDAFLKTATFLRDHLPIHR